MRLVGLNVHPLKSGAIRPVRSIDVLPGGLRGDRRWMVVDGDGCMVSAREVHRLFHVVADTPDTDPGVASALRLRMAGLPDLHLDVPSAEPEPVRLFSLDLRAVAAGADADAWVRAALGRDDVRLVWCDDPTRRTLQPGFSRPGDHAAFPDSFPVTVASLASMRQLDDWILERALELGEQPPEPLPIERFRANLVVDGDEPFAEDRWTALTVGGCEVPGGQARRPLRDDDDRHGLADDRQGADPHPGPPPELGREDVLRRAPGAGGRGDALGRRRGHALLRVSPARPAGRDR